MEKKGHEKNPLNLLLTINRIRNLVKQINPDIIDAHYVTHYGFFAALTGKPFICSAWGSDIVILPKQSKLVRAITKFTLKKTKAVTCDAYHMAKAIEDLGADKGKIKLIYYGVDLHRVNPDNFREKFKRENGNPVITTVRNLEPRYDTETIIKSVPLVLKEFPNAKFIIIGDGSQRGYLENLAKSLNCSENVEFVGRVVNEKLPEYFVRSDVYVSTSLADGGLGAATAEAMTCEMPVIVTNFGDNRMWVEDGKNGFVIAPQDYEALAMKTIELLKNNPLREAMGKMNHEIIRTRLNAETEMAKLDQLYKDVLNGIKN
ncbi:MAG: glycosyltransferase family 4 protein [Candidatus Portnoybacteria bacterium]|nr:glycosyltransferase family 4 protein [Candidatus Portnoybacteria bacterium]